LYFPRKLWKNAVFRNAGAPSPLSMGGALMGEWRGWQPVQEPTRQRIYRYLPFILIGLGVAAMALLLFH
jgi:hypothetical protein